MKLHTFTGSAHSRKVETVIHHLGLDVDVETHNFVAGDLRGAAYAEINANGKVPVLVDGGFTLWESNAIMQYLADTAGDGALFPRDPRGRADIARWQFWELVHFNRAFGTLTFETVARPKLGLGEPDRPLVDGALADLARFAPVLEAHLKGRRFMVGDGLTLADYSTITFEAYRPALPFDWTPFPAITAYFDRMHDNAHWQRALAGQPLGKAKAA